MNINEATIEQHAIKQFEQLGWRYVHGKEILAGRANPWRETTADVVLSPLLKTALLRINPWLPESVADEVIKTVTQPDIQPLAVRNRTFYDWLKHGVSVRFVESGEEKHEFARLVDFQTASNNDFCMVNQLEITGKKGKRIPDLIGFVNGLPLAVFELKHPLAVNADLRRAFNQLQTYQAEIAELFVFNQAQVITDGTHARIGSLTAPFERFTPWKVVDEKNSSRRIAFDDELSGMIAGLFAPEAWLDYVQNFITFESNEKGAVVKKQAAYHQFYGVNEAVDCTLAAHAERSNRIGVMWHTQGSGKSLSMLFYAGKLLAQRALQNPTIVVVTDRNDLDGQLFATFCSGKALLRTEPVQADGREALREELAKRESGGVIFTTIQKFSLAEGESRFPVLNTRHNIIVISDEAHRSQYGLNQHINDKGEYRVGYARHLRDALPQASFIGFTGTPIALDDRDTQEVFGRYVSIYDIHDAVEDGATVPIIYEARQISLHQSEAFDDVVNEAQALLDDDDENSYRFRFTEQLMGADVRVAQLAADIVAHFAARTALFDGKAMVVVMSRRIALKLYNEIIKLKPEWHSADVHQGCLKIMMTGSASDDEAMRAHVYSKADKQTIEKRFKDPDDSLRMVIVCDMWLTGFDAPCCHTMYLDKPMKGHNLMQAIARVNRVFANKSRDNGGLIVDYVGLTDALRDATRTYTNSGGKSAVKTDVEAVFAKMQEYLTIIRDQFATPVDGEKIDVHAALAITEPNALLATIRRAASHILALDRINPRSEGTPRKNAFMDAVRKAKKGFSLCSTRPESAPYKQELAFYDAVRATIAKAQETRGRTSPRERQVQLVQLLNQAVHSDGVVDLFDLLAQEHPNIALLSDEFLGIVQRSDSKDLWVAALESFLKSEINDKAAQNLAVKKSFEDKLKEAMNRYQNHNLTVLEILEELIEMAKAIQQELSRGNELGLSASELAFYDALARNQSAVDQMGDVALIQLAQEITAQLRQSVTLDWQYKDAVRARMRLLIRRTLRKFKYPPDMQDDAVEFVLQQAESVAEGLTAG
ncbi:type I restriction endonuclease subunit R [Pasteurellaceae bacterium HPA106]|uniref:type I restriction endonuclease subunit R n=1 Tax=Spirabiliibacterium pneumoniae TaxID=221400 RepID=UPI001AADC077|nr:type I restriction endonuclease subunit R [Spirabiliibacterium pneumoniae]MBE2896381.1 type I restriction endonuclease subunit R [Spirabiliibacterium pneumoniae]